MECTKIKRIVELSGWEKREQTILKPRWWYRMLERAS